MGREWEWKGKGIGRGEGKEWGGRRGEGLRERGGQRGERKGRKEVAPLSCRV